MAFQHKLPIPTIPFKARSRSEKQREQGIHCGWKWRKFRNVLLAQHPLCARCGRLGEHVHHIEPRHAAPERMYDASNCMVLCKVCHDVEHA